MMIADAMAVLDNAGHNCSRVAGEILVDGKIVDRATLLAMADAIAPPPLSSKTSAVAQPGSAPQKRSRVLRRGRAPSHLGASGSSPKVAPVQIRPALARSTARRRSPLEQLAADVERVALELERLERTLT